MKRQSSFRPPVVNQLDTTMVIKENTNCLRVFLPHRKFRLTLSLEKRESMHFRASRVIRGQQAQGQEGEEWETEKNVHKYIMCVWFKRLLASLYAACS